MQVDSKLLDDLARVAGSAFGTLAGLKGEVEAQMRQQFERILGQMDVVGRDEFEAVHAMAAKAREEQELLADRVAALEATIATLIAERELSHEHPAPRRPAPRQPKHGEAGGQSGGETPA